MKIAVHVSTLALALCTFTACDGAGASGSSGAQADEKSGDEAANDGFTKVPNSKDGLLAKVPENAVPNGIGGAAGFHSEDDSFKFIVREDPAPDGAFEDAKKGAEELFFKEWISSEETEDGWVLMHTAPKLDLSGGEPKEVGVIYSFEVRKKIGDKVYTCTGGVEKEAGLQPSVDACKSLKSP
jgi:hypothetical protein